MHCHIHRPVEERVIFRDKVKRDIEAGKLHVPIITIRKKKSPDINRKDSSAKP